MADRIRSNPAVLPAVSAREVTAPAEPGAPAAPAPLDLSASLFESATNGTPLPEAAITVLAQALGYDVAPMEEGSEGRLARSVEQAKGALVQALAEGRLSDEQAAAARATLQDLLDP